jgi:DNA-binding CsgD family transcriptional regulator
MSTAQAAVENFRAAGDQAKESAAFGELSNARLCLGDADGSDQAARQGILVLERAGAIPPASPITHELTMAYALMASVCMNGEDAEGTYEFGTRAITLAEQSDDVSALAHALNSVGTLEMLEGKREGRLKLERSISLARAAQLDEDVCRGYGNMLWAISRVRLHSEIEDVTQEAVDYCVGRGLVLWERYYTAFRSRFALDRGDYETAARLAGEILNDPSLEGARLARVPALPVLGLARARRGDPEYSAPLDEASMRAAQNPWLQITAPVAAARAEAAWLYGRSETVQVETEATLRVARRQRVAWVVGELACWRWRAGVSGPETEGAAEPYALEMSGNWLEASEFWTRRCCPYEAALALASSNEPQAMRRALAELQRLGARPAANIVARRMRDLGIRHLARGPRPSTRSNVAHLTGRQIEILDLLGEGLRNAEIAERLSVSSRTVDHHVSAILDKLDARSRSEAIQRASRLGIQLFSK